MTALSIVLPPAVNSSRSTTTNTASPLSPSSSSSLSSPSSPADPFANGTSASLPKLTATRSSHLALTDSSLPVIVPSRNNESFTPEPLSRNNRLSFATIAREKTTSVLSSLAVRSRPSSTSLRSNSPANHHSRQQSTNTLTKTLHRPSRGEPKSTSQSPRKIHTSSGSALPDDQTSTKLDHELPEITLDRLSPDHISSDQRRLLDRSPSPSPHSLSENYPTGAFNKMHQTSSRLLRMTDEERPFTRDFKDLFSTLMVSLPLTPHRVRFQKIEHTFTSEEAINNLGSLKFSQSNRMPDPKDPSRIVTTTTTTTFSMAKEMARSVCQRFADARFIEPADGKPVGAFPLKGAVWQLTPKGMHVLASFCQRNGISQRHVLDVMDSPRNSMQLVVLERDVATDKLSHDRATVEVIFRRFAGQDGPNLKPATSNSDSDSLNDYYNGLIGVKMTKERKIGDRVVMSTFTGKAAVDWLLDCCTTVDRRETYEIADLFVQHGLIWPALEDKVYAHQNPGAGRFQPTKNSIYGLTEKGQIVAGWISRENTPNGDNRGETVSKSSGTSLRFDGRNGPRDSNNHRLTVIVNDAALRLLFREFLRDTHCEENLAFYLEVCEFTNSYDNAERAKAFGRPDAIKESLAEAYRLYNAFLAPGSPCELNIDHNLRNNLAGRMTRAVGDDEAIMLKSLQEVVALFKEAQQSVFKLMSSDSVPKFLKEPKYSTALRDHNFDHASSSSTHSSISTTLPERTLSRVARDPRADRTKLDISTVPPPPPPPFDDRSTSRIRRIAESFMSAATDVNPSNRPARVRKASLVVA